MKYRNKYLTLSLLYSFTAFAQTGNISKTSLIPLTPCDERYAAEIQLALSKLPENTNNTLATIAREYVIMLKQHYDLSMKITQIEDDILNTALIAILRVPLSNYASCTTKTTPIAQETSVTINSNP